MPSIDSNVLVRLLTRDDERQFAVAMALAANVESKEDALFVPLTVVLELEWVLRSRYDLDKPTVVDTLSDLLDTRELHFENEAVVERALALYRDARADFGECLHVSAASLHAALPFFTFDQSAAKLPGASLLR
jgi:predicted nucleic-acid-binding protein